MMVIQWELGEILVIEPSWRIFGDRCGNLATNAVTWRSCWRPFLVGLDTFGFFYKLIEKPNKFVTQPPSIRKSSRVEGVERCEAPDHPRCPPSKLGWNEPNRTVTCMVLKATANDRGHLVLCQDEFRGPRSGLCRSGGISHNNNPLI
ncbi:uncharacterized protein TNCV_600911 [Trichonephila clavipes]|nr:uncharacterized protein TNCV_600911 [Trichonephila clavipes]